jgi:hypothetical protein
MGYISSNANRWYCAREDQYGQVPAISAGNRIPAVSLAVQHELIKSQRRDKTGSRTWAGTPNGMRRNTSFRLSSYLRDWVDMAGFPPHGSLLEAALGSSGALWTGGTPAAGTTETSIRFADPHGLAPGQGISSAGEMRFVAAVADECTVILNAPFTVAPVVGLAVGSTATYVPASELPSVCLFDYWDPATAVQRIIAGAAIDRMTVALNGDFHSFEFRGMAQDVIDSASFSPGVGGLEAFPAEPSSAEFSYSPVPGNLGQVWLGAIPNQLFTVSDASIEVRNNIEMRNREFGSSLPRGITPGAREVLMTLELFSQDDEATTALYQSARRHAPVGVMFQMGAVPGSMLGIYLKSLLPDVPQFDDSEKRLKWTFRDTRAQGTVDDEIAIAFG